MNEDALSLELDKPTISTHGAKKYRRQDGFSATNEVKACLLKLNRQTPCSPRSAVSVNQEYGIGSFTHRIQFAFDNGGDQPGYVAQH